VTFTQLGPVKKVSERVFKVLVHQTMTITPAPFEQQRYGLKPEVTTTRIWKFADCSQGLFGQGFSSDIKGVEMRTVYDEQGSPERRSFSNNIYSQWEALCSAGKRS
jgi:hypothetical protein